MIRFERAGLLDDEGLSEPARRRRALALELAEAALLAVEPFRATSAAIGRLRDAGHRLDGATLFAFGKASVPMARAAATELSIADGIVLALEEASVPRAGARGLDVLVASHPAPAANAARTGRRVLRLAERLTEGDVALALVSGGGSAMLELPVDGVRVPELSSIAAACMDRGADIGELNVVRSALSRLKGGGLARAIAPAGVVNVILSDVPGRSPSVVASGPTCAAESPNAVAEEAHPRAVLERLGLLETLSPAARVAIEAYAPREVSNVIAEALAADHRTARRAVIEAARELGVDVRDRAGTFAGEARALGTRIGASNGAWVWGGETTVTVKGPGRGGRNRELALAALAAGWEAGSDDGLLLALGTDGVDGAEGAAGAIVDARVRDLARARGLDPARFLADNDSGAFFDAVGTALVCGPTSTNVADLLLWLP